MEIKKYGYEVFKKEAVDRIKEFLPEESANVEISLRTVLKNNGVKLDGLCIKEPGVNMSPTIYLNSYYKDIEDGKTVDSVLKKIADFYLQNKPTDNFDISEIVDFEKAQNKITCRLVNAKENTKMLESRPHTLVADLAVIYSIKADPTGEVPISNELMKEFGTDVEHLHMLALENMNTLAPVEIEGIVESLVKSFKDSGEDLGILRPMIESDFLQGVMVLSNTSHLYGAAEMLNEDVMSTLLDRCGEDFCIIPSSVHEVIIFPNELARDIDFLKGMVGEVNSTVLKKSDFLSDSVYKYDTNEKKIIAVA